MKRNSFNENSSFRKRYENAIVYRSHIDFFIKNQCVFFIPLHRFCKNCDVC